MAASVVPEIELSPAQQEAALQAAAAQEVLARAVAQVPSEERRPLGQNGRTLWESYGGKAIDALLEHTPLIDIEYLISLGEHGGIVPRGQEVPQAALITVDEAWRLRLWPFIDSLAVLVLSYPWLDYFHPDVCGSQLTRWLPIFKLMLKAAKSYSPHATVGVMMDYMSLPQMPRSESETARFERSLHAMNEWYFHPFTVVLLVTTPPPDVDSHAYSNGRTYHERGWCNFEMNACLTIKNDQCLWDLSQMRDGVAEYGAHGYPAPPDTLVGLLKAGRSPPLSPPLFASRLRAGVAGGTIRFTNADHDVVVDQFSRGFAIAWEGFKRNTLSAQPLWLEHLGWTDADGAVLLETLRHAARTCTFADGALVVYCLDGNRFTAGFVSELSSACEAELQGKFDCKSGRDFFDDFPPGVTPEEDDEDM